MRKKVRHHHRLTPLDHIFQENPFLHRHLQREDIVSGSYGVPDPSFYLSYCRNDIGNQTVFLDEAGREVVRVGVRFYVMRYAWWNPLTWVGDWHRLEYLNENTFAALMRAGDERAKDICYAYCWMQCERRLVFFCFPEDDEEAGKS